MTRDSPTCERASVHQMAFGQVGAGVGVAAGSGVALGLLAMICWTSATAVRRTFVAWAAGESGATALFGEPQASAMTASASTTSVAATSWRSTRGESYP